MSGNKFLFHVLHWQRYTPHCRRLVKLRPGRCLKNVVLSLNPHFLFYPFLPRFLGPHVPSYMSQIVTVASKHKQNNVCALLLFSLHKHYKEESRDNVSSDQTHQNGMMFLMNTLCLIYFLHPVRQSRTSNKVQYHV